MPNQYKNKIIYGNQTLIDLTGDTVTSNNLLNNIIAHDASGATITGTIVTKTSTDLIASGATVTVPAGYYNIQATKSVASGSATGPSSLNGSSATISTGTNIITLTKTGVTTTPTVSAGYVSAATASTATVALTASVTTKGAATITPGTTNQTIASGTYLTGTQTIAGDTNLVPSNIRHDVDIFGNTGTFGMKVDTIATTLSDRATSITFTGLKTRPLFFSVGTTSDITMSRSYRNIVNICYDGTNTHCDTYYLSGGNSGYGRYFNTVTWTYNNGSITITSAGTGTTGYFYVGTWKIIYCYEA